jgi:anti-sigma B factor antagonist
MDPSGTLAIVLRGDIDFTSSPVVLEAIHTGTPAAGVSTVCVDLGAVDFMDSSGMSVLVQILHMTERRGATLRVEHATPKVLDQLHLSGLAEVFDLPGPPPRWSAEAADGPS